MDGAKSSLGNIADTGVLQMTRHEYPEDYKLFRKVYGIVPNDPPSVAFIEWERTASERKRPYRPARPPTDLLCVCVRLSKGALDSQNKGKRLGQLISMPHSRTWLSQARWEQYEGEAETVLANEERQRIQKLESEARIAAGGKPLQSQWMALQKELGSQEEFDAYFSDATYDEATKVMSIPSPLKCALIDGKYIFKLRRTFDPDIVVRVR